MASHIANETFGNFEYKLFSFQSILSSDNNDPDKIFFNDKLQEIDSPYFSLENFTAISEKLNRNNFSLLHLNIKSLNKNIDDFREFITSFKGSFSVIVLTESWCDETTINNSLLNLENYNSVHQTRKGKKGGRICHYIHNSLDFKIRNDIDKFDDDLETCSIEIVNCKSKNVIITGIYRAPKSDVKLLKNYCKNLLKKKNTNDKTVFILGDLNVNSLDYDNNESVKTIFNMIFQCGFLPLIQRATRVTRTTATAIDHIITDAIFDKTMHSGIIKTQISDDFPIFTILENCKNCKNNEKTKITKRDFNEENIQNFHFLLENINWDQFLPSNAPNEAYNNFLEIFSDLYDIAFP